MVKEKKAKWVNVDLGEVRLKANIRCIELGINLSQAAREAFTLWLKCSAGKRNKLLARLAELKLHGDPEADHSKADALLLEYIGDPEVTAAFEAIERWYA